MLFIPPICAARMDDCFRSGAATININIFPDNVNLKPARGKEKIPGKCGFEARLWGKAGGGTGISTYGRPKRDGFCRKIDKTVTIFWVLLFTRRGKMINSIRIGTRGFCALSGPFGISNLLAIANLSLGGRCNMARNKLTMDGNTAAAHVSYAFTEVAGIYRSRRPADGRLRRPVGRRRP